MSDRVRIGTRKGLFTVRRHGHGDWRIEAEPAFLGEPVTMLCDDPRDGSLYVALEHGHFGAKMHRSSDDARTFDEVAVPSYPERPVDADDVDPIRNAPLEWKLKSVWELAPGGPDQDGLLWCGTIPGGLFRSEDRGDSWELVEALWYHEGRKRWFGGGSDLPALHSVLVHPGDADDVLVGVSCGGAWRTRDGGASWELHASGMRADFMPPEQQGDPGIQDPHRIARCAGAPDVLWCQHHCGIFKSTNGGAEWTEIEDVEPSAFGFGVAVHPDDPDCAWFVPAVKDSSRYPNRGRVVVNRTRDGGATFETLTAGLPQEHAYDLVYRHALDVDGSGERLVFGSTTGSVWITEDGGEHWHTVSTHLPPIYVTRFAGV